MGRWSPAPIVGGAYSDDTRPWSVQDTVNLIPVFAERDGTRSPKMLRCAPGYSDFVDLGTNAPIRGMRNVEGLLLVVSGNNLFSVNPNGTKANLGTIPGVGRVIMSHNQITGGNQVAITPGYVYDTVKATLARITDEGFPGAISFDYIDSYITFIEPGRRFAGTSDLADATSYSTLDQVEAEGSPDKLVGQIVSHREWWLFGERTIEPYVNTGAQEGTFQRSSGTVMEIGAASPYAIVNLDNSVFWLGNDGVVYRANGYSPVRISTYPIEQAISRCTTNTAFAFTYEDRGHKIFYLTFQDGHTWGYDVATQEWHRRQSKDLKRWRINDLVKWNGKWIAGDFSNGKLYTLDWDVQSEAGVEMERMRVTGVLSDDQNAVIVNALELVFDTGQPQKEPAIPTLAVTGNAPDGVVSEDYSFTGYVVSGGVPPYTFTVSAGTLPGGLGPMDPATGGISGDPTTEQVSPFTVQVTDSKGSIATTPDSITIRLQSMQTAVLADAPILYWPLKEMSGTAAEDLSGNDYTGQYQGAFSLTGDGVTFSTLSAGVFLDCGSPTGSPMDVGSLPEWAIEVVVTYGGAKGSASGILACQWRSPNLGLFNASVDMNFQSVGNLRVAGRMNDDISASASDPVNVPSGQETVFMATKVSNILYLYRNGTLVAQTASISPNNASNGAGFAVGGVTQSGYFPTSYGFLGKIRDVSVYDHGLSAVRAMAHAVAAGVV